MLHLEFMGLSLDFKVHGMNSITTFSPEKPLEIACAKLSVFFSFPSKEPMCGFGFVHLVYDGSIGSLGVEPWRLREWDGGDRTSHGLPEWAFSSCTNLQVVVW